MRLRTSPVVRQKSRRAQRRFRLELLESRTLLATMLWASDSSGDWDVASNWVNAADPTDNHVPTAADDAAIDYSDITVTHDSATSDAVNSLTSEAPLSFSAGSLSISSTSSISGGLTISGGSLSTAGNLTVGGSLTWTGGTVSGGGTLAAEGGIAICGNGATLDSSTLDNYGVATWTGGTITADNGAVFNNESGATFDAQSDASFGWDGSGAVPTFNNLAGASFVKSGGSGPSGTQMSLVFNNAGAVDVSAGTLALGDSDVVATAISSGSFEGGAGDHAGVSHVPGFHGDVEHQR